MTKSSSKITVIKLFYIYQNSRQSKLTQMDDLLNNKQTDLSERQKVKSAFRQAFRNL